MICSRENQGPDINLAGKREREIRQYLWVSASTGLD